MLHILIIIIFLGVTCNYSLSNLNLSDTTSKIRTVAMFAIVDL